MHSETTASPICCPCSPCYLDGLHDSPKLYQQHRQDLSGVQPMTLYELRDRRFVGSSIGYYKMITLGTFEDRDLARKECRLLRQNNSGSYAHIVTIES